MEWGEMSGSKGDGWGKKEQEILRGKAILILLDRLLGLFL